LWNRHFDRILELPGILGVPPYACDVNKDGLDELLVLDGDKFQVYASERVKARPGGGSSAGSGRSMAAPVAGEMVHFPAAAACRHAGLPTSTPLRSTSHETIH
jgi:hypothetical protein